MIVRIDAWEPLAQYAQFVLHNERKEPLNPNTLSPGNPHDSANWLTLDDAIARANMHKLGIGFVATTGCPVKIIDIDHCLMPDGTWSPLAQWVMSVMVGAYWEISMSGEGLHCLFTGHVPDHSCKNIAEGVELYTEGRYVALTGTNAIGNAAQDCTAGIQQVVQQYFQPTLTDTSNDWNTEAVEGWDGILDDAMLIQRMTSAGSADARAAAAFGGDNRKATLNDLWTANASVLGFSYPHDTKPYDESSADAALAQHLAFWTGNNHERMKQLMLQSALVRDKWDWHKNYLGMTIRSAAGRQVEFHKQTKKPEVELVPCEVSEDVMINEARKTSGHQFMSVDQEIEFFKGHTYVQSDHKILTPRGHMMKQDQFNAVYGGYEFTMTSDNSKTTNKPWDAFLINQAVNFPKADHKVFRPILPPGVIVDEDGHTGVNIYVPIETKKTNASVAPFLHHMKLLFPNGDDADIAMSYMASLVQNPGVKFTWCPVIQGVEGNGKTFLMKIMEYCIGSRYCHFPNAGDLSGNGLKFNAWLYAKLFIGCDEIHTNNRFEVLEGLKPILTNLTLEYQFKGKDQFVGDNLANWMTCTNHKDAVPITRNNRRYATFYTGQQSVEDVMRTMGGDYFQKLWGWFNNGGAAAINGYFRSLNITPKYNPATECQRAPITTSTAEALSLSLGRVEQEIQEAIDRGDAGFRNGWISSIPLTRLLKEHGYDKFMPPNKRKDMLETLGYIPHPSLRGGRVNNTIVAEDGKARLYVHYEHPSISETNQSRIVHLYTDSQSYSTGLSITNHPTNKRDW